MQIVQCTLAFLLLKDSDTFVHTFYPLHIYTNMSLDLFIDVCNWCELFCNTQLYTVITLKLHSTMQQLKYFFLSVKRARVLK